MILPPVDAAAAPCGPGLLCALLAEETSWTPPDGSPLPPCQALASWHASLGFPVLGAVSPVSFRRPLLPGLFGRGGKATKTQGQAAFPEDSCLPSRCPEGRWVRCYPQAVLTERPPSPAQAARHKQVNTASAPVPPPSARGGPPSRRGTRGTGPSIPLPNPAGLGCQAGCSRGSASQALVGLQGLWGLRSHHTRHRGSSGGVVTTGDGHLHPRGRAFCAPQPPPLLRVTSLLTRMSPATRDGHSGNPGHCPHWGRGPRCSGHKT